MLRVLLLPVALVAALHACAAVAHSFYPASCCSDHDCYPVKGKPATGGHIFIHPDGRQWLIPFSEIRPSEDEDYHLCLPPGREKPVCAFAPPLGV